MTRETKIGLLVGLLFIVMFGLVLTGLTNNDAGKANAPVGDITAAPSNTGHDVRAIAYTPELEHLKADGPAHPGEPAATGGDDVAAIDKPVINSEMLREDPGDKGLERNGPEFAMAEGSGSQTEKLIAASKGGKRTFRIEDMEESNGVTGEEGLPEEAAKPVEPEPVGPEPVRPEPVVVAAQTYEVKQGDTLYAIAKKYYGPNAGTKAMLILQANKSTVPNEKALKVGMKLVIPPAEQPRIDKPSLPTELPVESTRSLNKLAVLPLEATEFAPERTVSKRVYKVHKGDTLYKIARSANTTVSQLLKANPGKISGEKSLKIGTELTLPG